MPRRVRDRLLEEYRPELREALSCADRVVAEWNRDTTTDRAAVVDPYERALRERDALGSLLAAFVRSAIAAGYDPAGRPVAAPPFAVVTAEGVVLRLPVDDGRLVCRLRAFDRDPYRRGPPLPSALSIERRGTSSSDG